MSGRMHQGRVHEDEKLRGREGLKVGVHNKIRQSLYNIFTNYSPDPISCTNFLGIRVHASKQLSKPYSIYSFTEHLKHYKIFFHNTYDSYMYIIK